MAPLPKRKHSTARKGARINSKKVTLQVLIVCKNCGQMKKSHIACNNCGK